MAGRETFRREYQPQCPEGAKHDSPGQANYRASGKSDALGSQDTQPQALKGRNNVRDGHLIRVPPRLRVRLPSHMQRTSMVLQPSIEA